MKDYVRQKYYDALWKQLHGAPNLLQIVTGPRQIGKTTLALQLQERWQGPTHYATADQPATPDRAWITKEWEKMRQQCSDEQPEGLLILDEIQKIPQWSTVIKHMFDENRMKQCQMRILLLGSSALLMQKGLTESLAGRFELHRHAPWSFTECRKYFGTTMEEYLFFGGYPLGLSLRNDEERWGKYMRDALIETVLSKDLLLMTNIRKPALLRQLFGIVATHPTSILSYQKMLGSLQDVGNATTLVSYVHLLSQAFLAIPLRRWSGSTIRQRGSQPKIIIPDNGIASAMAGWDFALWRKEETLQGRMMENAVGAALHLLTQERGGELFYWRNRQQEVDFVLRRGEKLYAIEVKRSAPKKIPAALCSFIKKTGAHGIVIAHQCTGKSLSRCRLINLQTFLENPSLVEG